MSYLLSLVFDGLALGALYGLVALGFVLIFKSTGVVNFAQGSFVMVAGYLVYDFEGRLFRAPFGLALAAAAIAMVLLSVAAQRVVLARSVGAPLYTLLMLTLGLDIVLRATAQIRYGVQPISVPIPFHGDLHVTGLTFAYERIGALLAGAITAALFGAFFQYTRLGLSMRVTAADHELAQMLGVATGKVSAIAWALAGLLSLVAGVFLVSLPGYGLEPATAGIALRAFPAAILGGLDSLPGAVIGGLLIGLVETLTAGYQPQIAPWLGPGAQEVTPYLVMVLIMLFRPQGLLGSRRGERL